MFDLIDPGSIESQTSGGGKTEPAAVVCAAEVISNLLYQLQFVKRFLRLIRDNGDQHTSYQRLYVYHRCLIIKKTDKSCSVLCKNQSV